MSKTVDDHELIKQIKEGNEAAFRTLINRHREKLVNFCVKFLGSQSEGEDVHKRSALLSMKSWDHSKVIRYFQPGSTALL